MSGRHVAIAGGGLAGLTCAKYLLDADFRVTLVEAAPFLGGRASTFRDGDGEWIEQGLHLFLGVYSEFTSLLEAIGRPAAQILHWTDRVHFHDPDGPDATYGINPLNAPVSMLLGGLGQNDYLEILDKLSILPLGAPALTSLENIRQKYDGLTVVQWWKETSGREVVLERMLRPLCRALQFTEPEQFSAYDFLGWIHDSIYDLPNVRLGGYRGPRDQLIFAPLGKHLTDRGAVVRTQQPLRQILFDSHDRRISGYLLDRDERLVADAYVIALPAWNFLPLIPHALSEERFFSTIASLPIAPAISVQIWFDRDVVSTPEFHLVAGSRGAVFQQQSPVTYPVGRGNRISVVVAPADDLLGFDDQELVQIALRPLRKANSQMGAAKVFKSVVLRHSEHLIRPLPGAMSARPGQKTPIDNLFLAGDWTQQEFFGSQEGAVRGGKYCCSAIRECWERHES